LHQEHTTPPPQYVEEDLNKMSSSGKMTRIAKIFLSKGGLSFFDFPTSLLIKLLWQINGSVLAAVIRL
jgi:hypothetical protein